MGCAVATIRRFTTAKTPGFITSDEPVVWFDPASHKRPPMFQGPALMCDTIEISMSISPTRMLFFGRQNAHWAEHVDLDALDLNERPLNDLNRRKQKVVVSRNEFRPIWAGPARRRQVHRARTTRTKTRKRRSLGASRAAPRPSRSHAPDCVRRAPHRGRRAKSAPSAN